MTQSKYVTYIGGSHMDGHTWVQEHSITCFQLPIHVKTTKSVISQQTVTDSP